MEFCPSVLPLAISIFSCTGNVKNSKARNLNSDASNLNLVARSFYEMRCCFFALPKRFIGEASRAYKNQNETYGVRRSISLAVKAVSCVRELSERILPHSLRSLRMARVWALLIYGWRTRLA